MVLGIGDMVVNALGRHQPLHGLHSSMLCVMAVGGRGKTINKLKS